MAFIKCPMCDGDVFARAEIHSHFPMGQDGRVKPQCMCKGIGLVRVEYHEITQADIDNSAELRALMQLKTRAIKLPQRGSHAK